MAKFNFKRQDVSLVDKEQQKADRALARGDFPKEVDVDFDKKVSLAILEEPEPELLSVEGLQKIYPRKVNRETLEECVKMMNESIVGMDSVMREHYRDNLVGVIDVIKEGERIKFADYVKAVKFCSFKMAGYTDTRAYSLTFPERIERMAREGISNANLYVYANSYAKNKVVVEIMAKLMVPTHIMYQDYFHMAVKTQVEIMTDDKVSPKVRSDAANSLMTHLKQPEIKQAELSINTNDSGIINQLSEALNNLSKGHKELLSQGRTTLKDISEAVIIEVEKDE
jgi:N4 gp69-like protein